MTQIDDTEVTWVDAGALTVGDVVVFDGILRTVHELDDDDKPCLRSIPGEPVRVALTGRVLRVNPDGMGA